MEKNDSEDLVAYGFCDVKAAAGVFGAECVSSSRSRRWRGHMLFLNGQIAP